MATNFKNVLYSEIGISEVEVISVATLARSTVIGLSLTNLTGGIILATIRVENNSVGVTAPNDSAYYVKDVVVPPNQSLRVINGGEKLILAGDMKVYVSANTAASMDLVASYVEIT
jgi:hypothetical protein